MRHNNKLNYLKKIMNNTKFFRLRIPIKTAEWIHEEAKENKRSLNAQIVFCIEQVKKAAAQFGDEPAALSKKITKEILT